MKFSQKLQNHIKDNHLLSHPFYQAWMKGELSTETLQEYASQYYHHVAAFPRYISAAHANCADANQRKVLLENLNEEEGVGGTPHPEMWLDFAEGLGLEKKDVKASQKKEAISQVIEQFMESGKSSYAEGLASLYAYEYQVPEVASSKIEGLETNYSISDEKTLRFFKVHEKADLYHRQACEELLDQLPESEQKLALIASRKASQSLWNFLSSLPIEGHDAA